MVAWLGAAGVPSASGVPAGSAKPSEPVASAAIAQADDPDLDVNLAQPDFMLASLPTALRLPRHKMTFRLTHRFHQRIQDSGPGDLFGLDTGAQVGIEFRFGVVSGAQLGFYRTGERTIQFFTQYDVARQGRRLPVGVAAYASIEGTNNFQDSYSPSLGAILSREVGTRAALYAEPMWVSHAAGTTNLTDRSSTAILGLGIRLRVLRTVYVVAEAAPRAGGDDPGTTHAAFGIERRAGGHLFQLTIANNKGTTLANMARGAPAGGNWYLGFNLARKFY